uniref:NADH-ubiquinone oxidoreductase chain 6 n=1 Tax=Oryzaephilus surinamensis TaxID=41112 RepID=A0A1P8YZK3_ORYSU|nr:NADH dehydrogenase subunit 6 [Oryzaephilus surinamensis]
MLTNILAISTMIMFMKHPISMGMTILIQVILVAMNLALKYSNPWFSYILFMIMVGGLMVLFMYMTSVASNEKFKFSIKLLMLFFMINLSMNILSLKMKITPTHMLLNKPQMPLTKYLSIPSNIVLITMIIYLLITLIATIKIVNINSGPLRQKF